MEVSGFLRMTSRSLAARGGGAQHGTALQAPAAQLHSPAALLVQCNQTEVALCASYWHLPLLIKK